MPSRNRCSSPSVFVKHVLIFPHHVMPGFVRAEMVGLSAPIRVFEALGLLDYCTSWCCASLSRCPFTNRQNEVVAKDRVITSLEQQAQDLSTTIDGLKEATQVERAEKAAAAAARDEAQVDLASCSAHAADLDSVSAELAGFVAAAFVGQHPGAKNRINFTLDAGSDGKAPVEAVLKRARWVFRHSCVSPSSWDVCCRCGCCCSLSWCVCS